MPQQIRAVVVDPSLPDRLAIREVRLRDRDRDEVVVRVTAFSLNRGETRRALQLAEVDWRPGWDFAGIVETTAADGSGPTPSTRVVGILPSGAWAERVNCRSHAVAALPEAVSDAQAAGRRADRAACAAPRRVAAWPQGLDRRCLGWGRASRLWLFRARNANT